MSDLFLSEISPPRAEATQRRGLYRNGGKRCFDLVFSLLLLALCAPLIVLCWGLARRDGGPGFFRQRRIGRNGRAFDCLKIRTMAPDAEAAGEEAHPPTVRRDAGGGNPYPVKPRAWRSFTSGVASAESEATTTATSSPLRRIHHATPSGAATSRYSRKP